jgi:hypothetical protein
LREKALAFKVVDLNKTAFRSGLRVIPQLECPRSWIFIGIKFVKVCENALFAP